MRVGVIQSCFIPWRGYFDFIDSVDLFVFHDDIQYTKGDWRNRNLIKTPHGLQWITVPVIYRTTSQLICQTLIDRSRNWQKRHFNLWEAYYRNAPFLDTVLKLLEPLKDDSLKTISELNIRLIRSLCDYLEIKTPFAMSQEFNLTGSKTDRLIQLLKKVKATVYLSGPSAEAYLEKDKFVKAGIGLEYKTYDYAPYPQLWGAFEGTVSVLDLIANCGHQSKSFIKSKTPNRTILYARANDVFHCCAGLSK